MQRVATVRERLHPGITARISARFDSLSIAANGMEADADELSSAAIAMVLSESLLLTHEMPLPWADNLLSAAADVL